MKSNIQVDQQPAVAAPYQLHRLGIIMRPEADNELEEGGVLNPGGVRTKDGSYLLFPRLVAMGNYSRIGVARVVYDELGIPIDVERQGVALEPTEPYECNTLTGGGCEDARVAYVEPLGCYVMTYVAFGPTGPHPALATSTDLYSWTRRGLIDFAPFHGADMNIYSNKDHMLFPELVSGPDGKPALAMLHRPMFQPAVSESDGWLSHTNLPPGVDGSCWTMWISYCPLDRVDWATDRVGSRPYFSDHQELIGPEQPWEAFRMGAGTPPVRIGADWLTYYHGVEMRHHRSRHAGLRYSAGVLLLDSADPRRVLYRSATPSLEPMLPEEVSGIVSDVVFPTAIDTFESYVDVYYGMADRCIGVARATLPPGAR